MFVARHLLLIAVMLVAGCSLVVDFDRSLLIDASVDASFDAGGGAGGAGGTGGAGGADAN